ncbi:hypothetical protein DFH27DRAFT_544495 [Peziza echinospora]|nr:hypothetical protein DFH27DRAFT_544495 [Peziza echinospora]
MVTSCSGMEIWNMGYGYGYGSGSNITFFSFFCLLLSPLSSSILFTFIILFFSCSFLSCSFFLFSLFLFFSFFFFYSNTFTLIGCFVYITFMIIISVPL